MKNVTKYILSATTFLTTSFLHADQAKEVAEKIGLILRSTRVKRGIGTIRQDVNLSIKGGART